MMRYLPLPSVTAVRAFSISAGLATSTATPGSTAPDESVTTPVTDGRIDCAAAAAGSNAMHITRLHSPAHRRFPAATLRITGLLALD